MGLVDVTDLRRFLGLEEGDQGEDLLQGLLDQAENLFLRATNRLERPFQAAQSARVEVLDGTGCAELFLDYPVGALSTTITIGYASPWEESLNPADPAVISFEVGSRRVVRVDGGKWTTLDRPNVIRVTYDAQADEPEDAKLAILRRAAANYRESGEPEATSDRVLPDGENLPLSADADTIWNDAVAGHWEPRI